MSSKNLIPELDSTESLSMTEVKILFTTGIEVAHTFIKQTGKPYPLSMLTSGQEKDGDGSFPEGPGE